MNQEKRDRARGCLLAAAFGDSLGASVEFMSREAILDAYGPSGPRSPDGFPDAGPGSVTDDTQQALAVCRGLVHGMRRGPSLEAFRQSVWFGLKVWRKMQSYPSCNRSPGLTSLSALESDIPGSPEVPLNDSASCGAVMRAHPIGVLAGNPEMAFRLGLEIGVMTHGHADGFGPAGAMAAMVSCIIAGDSLYGALEKTIRLLERDCPEATETIRLLKIVRLRDPEHLDDPGFGQGALGWEGSEALAMAVHAALRHPADLVSACAFAAAHSGDSDSVASMAGALVGASQGSGCVPSEWVGKLEHSRELAQWAERLIELSGHFAL
jgi:ADP-ribosylglycohydrolase